MAQQYPLIGTAIWIEKEGKYLLGERASAKRGGGSWCPPGGHLEMFETLLECVVRETREEAAIEIKNVKFLTMLEMPDRAENSHYLCMYYRADWELGEPKESPSELLNWNWFEWGKFPTPLFGPTQNFVNAGLKP